MFNLPFCIENIYIYSFRYQNNQFWEKGQKGVLSNYAADASKQVKKVKDKENKVIY